MQVISYLLKSIYKIGGQGKTLRWMKGFSYKISKWFDELKLNLKLRTRFHTPKMGRSGGLSNF